jgi:hypothetical protein
MSESYRSPIEIAPLGITGAYQIFFENGRECYIDEQGFKVVIVEAIQSAEPDADVRGNTRPIHDVQSPADTLPHPFIGENVPETPVTVSHNMTITGTPTQIVALQRTLHSPYIPYNKQAPTFDEPDGSGIVSRLPLVNSMRVPSTQPAISPVDKLPQSSDQASDQANRRRPKTKVKYVDRLHFSVTKGDLLKRAVGATVVLAVLYNGAHAAVIAKDAHNIKNTYTNSTPFFGPFITGLNEVGPLADDMFNPASLLKLLPENK